MDGVVVTYYSHYEPELDDYGEHACDERTRYQLTFWEKSAADGEWYMRTECTWCGYEWYVGSNWNSTGGGWE